MAWRSASRRLRGAGGATALVLGLAFGLGAGPSGVPQASRLRYLLAESGIELPECYQLEELADSLAAYLKGGAGHAS